MDEFIALATKKKQSVNVTISEIEESDVTSSVTNGDTSNGALTINKSLSVISFSDE